MQRAVDGDNITLGKHVLEGVDTAAANLLLDLSRQRLVVIVEQFLAVEGLQTTQDTLTDTADGNGTNDLVLEIVLVLGDGSNIPFTLGDLLVGGDEVADESQDGHDDVLGHGGDIAAGDFGNGDTAVGGVGSVEVDVIRSNTGRHGQLEVLGLGQTLCGQVTGVEGSGDDDLSVDEFLVEGRVFTFLVGGGHQSVALAFNPFAQAEFVLGGTQKTGLLLGVLAALYV